MEVGSIFNSGQCARIWVFVCTLYMYEIWYPVFLSAESCDLACVRRRSEKRLRKTIRTLRKSINREQFHLHFAGSEYELAKKLVRPADPPDHCGTGQILLDKKCGEGKYTPSVGWGHKIFVRIHICIILFTLHVGCAPGHWLCLAGINRLYPTVFQIFYIVEVDLASVQARWLTYIRCYIV